MKFKNKVIFICFTISLNFLSQSGAIGKANRIKNSLLWRMTDVVATNSMTRILGNPKIVEYKYRRALEFNGVCDGLFLNAMPLANLTEFTIEAIFKPESGGNFEQRFFHCGEINGSRVLLELRSTQTGWYFDAFVKSGDQSATLIDPNLIHPLDKWYHVAFVVTNGKQETYINGNKELESQVEIAPLTGGKTSIGVRQNEQSWFKGAIYKIRISPEALTPVRFMK